MKVMVFRDIDHLQVTLNIDDTIIIEQVLIIVP